MGDKDARDQEPGDPQVPAERAPEVGPVGRHMESIEATMKLQAEILKRMHDNQEELSRTIKDTNRSEMMIQSTRSLNESFMGMKRVQESLIDRIGDHDGARKWVVMGAVLGIAAVVLVIFMSVDSLRQGVESVGDQVQRAAEEAARPTEDPGAKAALEEIRGRRERMRRVEGRDQAIFLERLSKLESQIQVLREERQRVATELTSAQQALATERASSKGVREELARATEELAVARKETGRLTARSVANEELIARLNDLVASLKRQSSVPGDSNPQDAPAVAAATAPTTEKPAEGAEPPGEGEAEEDAPSSRNVTPAFIADFNKLLSRHRGGEDYRLITAGSYDVSGMNGVVLEVRGRDGSLAKTIRAEQMGLSLAAAGGFLEMDFEDGYVEFRHGLSRTVKSPFFKGRYQIVVPGIEQDDWLGASLAFLKMK